MQITRSNTAKDLSFSSRSYYIGQEPTKFYQSGKLKTFKWIKKLGGDENVRKKTKMLWFFKKKISSKLNKVPNGLKNLGGEEDVKKQKCYDFFKFSSKLNKVIIF